ncbi:hypothetical protein RCL1_008819 [Eukaryota sp. TZLM3-RCL]
MSVFQHNILQALKTAQEEAIQSDFQLVINEQPINCHKVIISHDSKRLNSAIQKNQDSFDVGDYDDVTVNDLVTLLHSFYGQTLTITNDNGLPLYLLSKALSCSYLANLSQTVLKTCSSSKYKVKLEEIMSNLKQDDLKDFEIVFHDVVIRIHKFLFAAISPYFRTKFSNNWQESEENCSNFTNLLQVSPSSLSNFFTSFYDGKLEVTLENAFEYSHLAWYFKLSELEKFVHNFIENSESEYNWVASFVSKAIKSEDFRFIKIISAKISEIPDLSNCDPIPVHPLFFENLNSNIDVSWLLKCLVFSYTNYSEENVWTAKSLEKSIEMIKTDSLPIDEIYQIIEPLFSISDLFDFLSSFSLSVFSKFTSQVPLNWFTWFIVESDLRKEFNLISQVSGLLNEIITPENIDQVPITSFNSETLRLFAINSKKEHLVIWMINCLIELWSNSQLNVKEFSRILMGFDLSETRIELVYSTLGKLFSNELIRTILFEFIALKLVPKLIQDGQEEKKSLRAEMNEQVRINAEQDSKISEQNHRINEQDVKINEQQLGLLNLQSRFDELSSIIQSIIKQQEEAEKQRLEEQKRLEELAKQQELEKSRVKFLASNKGSQLSLSENDTLALKAGPDGYDNSFVAVQHPVKGKVVVTLRSIGGNFWSFIGMFNSSNPQNNSDDFRKCHGLYLYSGQSYFRVLGSTQHTTSALTLNQQVVIEFNDQQVTFSIPSSSFSQTITWPTGCVFGLSIHRQNTSWQVSSE